MKKVTTPSFKEVQATTAVVIITVFIFGVYFWAVDIVIGHGDRLRVPIVSASLMSREGSWRIKHHMQEDEKNEAQPPAETAGGQAVTQSAAKLRAIRT